MSAEERQRHQLLLTSDRPKACGVLITASAFEIFQRHLPNWSFRQSVNSQLQSNSPRVYDDGFLSIRPGPGARFHAAFGNVAEFEIDFENHLVAIDRRGVSAETLDHLVLDQLLPRILAHQALVIFHAGAVRFDDRAILLAGPSGAGKSTLVASLDRSGFQMLGDDATIVDTGEVAKATCLYRSLRLFSDSAYEVLSSDDDWGPVATYNRKRQMPLSGGGAERSIGAIFLISQEPSACVRITRLEGAPACFALVAQTFALNPLDVSAARERLIKIGSLVKQVPIFKVQYPRRYSMLPAVQEGIFATLDSILGSA